ncbi:MAG TPA: serine/threonine-protein kinase [Steroidobacteraceae bacterium]|nr:serine/threonine-protein kinase [Steroidobacteraceae bacterium]
MRKFGLIAAIVGVSILGAGLLLRMLANSGSWLWLPGFIALGVGGAVLLWSRWSPESPVIPAPKVSQMVGTDTARLLDNFEQRFAELKRRKAGGTVLGDLYALGAQLESRGRVVQATAVFRHLARIDNTYKDVSSRLKRLMDTDRTEPKAAPTPPRAPAPAPSASPAGAAARDSSGMEGASRAAEGPEPQSLGRYKLEREIGRGAMGIVYLGRDTAINRSVAIKAIPLASEFTEAELVEARERFFREAETAGRLNHPNIVTIYDVGEERGLAYIAMEYLKGRHLSDHATSNNLLEPRKVLEVIGRTAEALGFAHKQQVVHRDIKPANLMYDASTDVLKITDFGIARLSGAGSTRTGIVLGTPSFMSPEQLEGRNVTGHSDLFSLGVSLFQLLTGHLPFTADSMTGLMQQIAEVPHPPLRAYRPDLPPCVEAIIDRALAKNPDERFDSGAQMAAALDDCRSRIPSGLP